MHRLVFGLFLCLALVPLFADDGGGVVLKSGSSALVKNGTEGRLILTDPGKLVFESGSGNLEIPYPRIQAFAHTQEVAVHLGWAPAIVVGTIKPRRRKHFLKLTYLDGNGVGQYVVFQIPKQMPEQLMMTLLLRAPDASCQPGLECDSIFRPSGHRQPGLVYRREIPPPHATPLGQTPR